MFVPVCRLTGQSADVVRGRISPDRSTITTASVDKSVIVWDTASASALQSIGGHEGEITDVCYHGNSHGIYTSCFDGIARLYDLRSSNSSLPAMTFVCDEELTCLSSGHDPNSPLLVTGSTTGMVRFFDVRQNRLCVSSFSHYNSICSLEVSGDDSMVISSSTDTTLRVFSTSKGDCLMSLNNGEIHPSPALYATFLPDSSGVVGLFSNASLLAWDLSERVYAKRKYPSPPVGSSTKTIASTGASGFAVPSSDGRVHFVDVDTGAKIQPATKAHADDVLSVDVVGNIMVSTSGGEDSSGVIWVKMDPDEVVRITNSPEYNMTYHLVCPQIEGLV
jgi:WD40 repeat protein